MCGYCQYVFYNYILLEIGNDSLKLNETFLTTDLYRFVAMLIVGVMPNFGIKIVCVMKLSDYRNVRFMG